MSRGICEQANSEGCWVAERKGGCFSDIDHKVPQRWRWMGLVVRKYISTPENKERLCRWEHEQKPDETTDLIPSQSFMLEAIFRAHESGDLYLNTRDKARLEFLYESEMDTSLAVLPTDHSPQVLENRVA